MSTLRESLRAAGAGRLLYLLWHKPRAEMAHSRREGGPLQQFINYQGRRAMMLAARSLPPRPMPDAGAPEVHFLTGRKFWYQTAFCLWSLSRATGRELTPVFIDDGTFDNALIHESGRLFPGRRVITAAEMETHLDASLPAQSFPALRDQRRTYIHLRKLTDVHAGRTGWRLVLDSDMLFFREPQALLTWLKSPGQAVHMLDVSNSYGYPGSTLQELAGRPLPQRLNVGILGLRSDEIDWGQLEKWCAALLASHGTSYYLEQALVALLATRLDPLRLPADDYLLMPADAECRAPRAVLHHYVDRSKRGYFRHAWRHIWTP